MRDQLPQAYWAVIEHHRWWLASDGCHWRQIREDKRLSLSVAKRIAREYSVARNIGQIADDHGHGTSGLNSLVQKINDADWPDGLVARAKVCVKIAEDHIRQCKALGNADRYHRPFSGVTKLTWFLRPEGWTMFDRYARIGLMDRRDDPMSFYEVLASQHFDKRANEITELCRQSGFELWGERIIDKLLLFRGSLTDAADKGLSDAESYYAAAVALNRQYLQLIPLEWSDRLHRLALQVASILPDESFPQRRSPRRQGRVPRASDSVPLKGVAARSETR